LGGFFTIPSADSKTVYKTIPLIEEDVDILRKFTFRFRTTPFFRHISGIQGVVENTPFGVKYFYKWWVKACANLGLEGVDLYGGTRHSSVRALIAAKYTPEQVKQAAMSETNAAFARYMGKASTKIFGRCIARAPRLCPSIKLEQSGHSKNDLTT